MDFDLIWQAVLIFVVATILLRIGGRKSIAQMTIPQTVIMIGIGTLLIQPITGNGLWVTFLLAGVLILSLIVTELIELFFDKPETIISGKAVQVIENGSLIEKNLKKLRMTVDQLEARLRQTGISSITHVQSAMIESNGQIGYQLKEGQQPATKEDIERLIYLIQTGQLKQKNELPEGKDIFREVQYGDPTPPPERLQ